MNLKRLLTHSQGPTLTRKLLVRILPLVIVSVSLVGLANYFVAQVQISHYIEKELQMLGDQMVVSTQSFLDQRTRDVETLSESPLLRDYHTNIEYGLNEEARIYQEEIRQYFAQFAKRSNMYDLVAYYDFEGDVVASVPEIDADESGASEKFLPLPLSRIRQAVGSGSSLVEQVIDGRVVIAQQVRRADETTLGTLVLVCRLDLLADILRRSQIGADGRAYIADAEGNPMLGQDPTGRADLHHQVPLSNSSWLVAVEASADEFIGPLAWVRNLTLMLSFGLAVLVSAILIAGIRHTMHPLSEVTEGTRRLALGELDYRLPAPQVRDLKPLVLAFNRMAAQLNRRDAELQARIRQLSSLRLMENTASQRLSEESVLRTCLRAVAEGLAFDRVGLYWIDRNQQAILGRYMHATTTSSFNESAFQHRRIPLHGDDVLNRVIASREPLLVTQPVEEQGVDLNYVREAGTRQFVAAPLCGKDDVFGVIVADNCATETPLTEHHRDGLRLFASAAGLSLENALLIDRLTHSEARHRTVLDNSPLAIMGISRDHRIHTWSRGAEAIFGYTADEIIGEPLTALLAPESLPHYQTLVNQLVQEGGVQDYQISGRSRSGDVLDLNLSWGGHDRDNFLANDEWTVVMQDVTESRKLQHQLIVSEKLSAVGQLIAGVAHELNNPLQAVVGYSELMLEADTPARVKTELHHIHDNAARCRKLIDNLLLFVRQGDVNRGPVCIQEVVDGSVKLLHHKLTRSSEAEIKLEVPDSPLYVEGNFQQIEQVLINLMTNARDALDSWDGRKEIALRAYADEDRVCVEVSDTGPGVPDDVKDRLFEPLFTTKPEGQGTGLGLPLCREIVENHEGRLRMYDNREGGATFLIDLPRTAAPPKANEIEPTDDTPLEAHTILLVEDEAGVRAWLNDVLVAAGHEVHAAEDIHQARTLADAHLFDLVVSDIHLPDGTGLDFFEGWARHSRQPRPRFLFLTGDIVSHDMEELCEESGSCVLQKPVRLKRFRQTVRNMLTASHLHA